MPIHVDTPVRPMSDAEFERIEYQVMGSAYEIHNRQGRLCDEPIYQSLLALACKASGFSPVLREVPVYEEHLRRLLRHTNLRAIEWLNMVNHDIAFKTVR